MTQVNGLKMNAVRTLIYIVLVVFLVMSIVPIWILLVNCTRSTPEIQQGMTLIPSSNLVNNWIALANRPGLNFLRGFGNSVLLAAVSTIVSVYFSALTAYGFAMFSFKGKEPLFKIVLATLTIPPALGIVGFYKYMVVIGLVDNYLSLILPTIAASGTVFFLRQYISSVVHKDLLDAARIDGCHEFKTFNQIILPILTPGLAVMAIFAFVGMWNNFLGPYILISNKDLYTLPMIVAQLKTDIYKTEQGAQYLGIGITIAPIIVFYIFMSRFIISGVTLGSVKE